MRRLVAGLIRRDLRRAFRRVVWSGSRPVLPPGPVVAYANHQSFHDGYLLWLVCAAVVHRPFLVWMEEVDRFPFFMLQGALPFPPHDAARRAAAIRRTRRALASGAPPLLAYFPEGRLHAADEPLLPIDAGALGRLHRILDGPTWWPVGIHLTWRGEARPTALLTGGIPTAAPPEDAGRTLTALRDALRMPASEETLILDGGAAPHERMSLRWARRLFSPQPGASRG